MEFPEPSKVLFNRIKKLEPDSGNKIVGYLLLRGLSEQEMINLAMSPDAVIQEVILKTKAQLSLCLKSPPSPISPPMNSPPIPELSLPFTPFSQFSSHPFNLPAAFHAPSPYWGSQVAAKHNSDFVPMSYPDSVSELEGETQFLSLEDQMEPVEVENAGFPSHYVYSDAVFGDLSARGPRHQSLNEFPFKTCHYFNKGFCKHGSNCRYFHGQISDGFPQKFDAFNDDHIFSPGSLEKLELEIKELLKSRKGNPVSIASLPMIYYEKYGKVLQADGYLTESQRHGRVGYSLTRLLARLKNSIQLIDRPHGQHAVILAEDAPKYLDNRGDRNDPGPIVSGSRQIYLTFPSESTFTEDDVSNYFNTFGPVEDVRIPCQQKRMFGFVTFESADTVKMVLAKRNPHYVCGARVLVKPYREKLKLIERKYHERIEPSMYYSPHYLDVEAELHSMPRGYETSRLLRKQIMEAQEQAFELERRHLAELQTMWKPTSKQSYFGYSMDGLKVSEENFTSPSEHISHLLDVLNTGSASDEKIKHVDSNYANQDSNQGLNLPESPFASPIVSSIS